MKLDGSRLVGVGKEPSALGSGGYLTQLWFAQDDHSVVVATYYEDCELKLSRESSIANMHNAAYAVASPKM